MVEKSTPRAPEQVSGKSELDYQLFIIIFTIFSLIIAAALFFLPLAPATETALLFINLMISVVFMVDFFYLLFHATNKVTYLKTQGWLDFLGSLPFSPLFRLFRVVRLVGGWRALSRHGAHPLWKEIVRRRAENALRYTAFVAILVITLGSLMVLQFESQSPQANILNGQDAIWWAIVTVATVGYGDYYPVTLQGRFVGVILMVVGVSIFGVLSSYLATTFLKPTQGESEEQALQGKENLSVVVRAETDLIRGEIDALHTELDEIRRLLSESGRVDPP